MTDSVFGTPDADGWYDWKGDEMVRPAGKVELQFRKAAGSWISLAEEHCWKHDGSIADIVKWRPAQ